MSFSRIPLEEVPCDICGSGEYRVRWAARLPEALSPSMFTYGGGAAAKSYHCRVVRCASCGLDYASPRPRFTSELYGQSEDPHYVRTEAARRKTFRRMLDAIRRTVPSTGSLLDVGCATGLFLDEARTAGYIVSGVEPSSWASGLARQKGLAVSNCAIEQYQPAEQFDVITCWDVLEHVDSPRRICQTMRQWLKPGGFLVINVPDMDTWHARLLGRHHWLVVLMHYFYFRQSTMTGLLRRSGFEPVRVEPAPPFTMTIADASAWFDKWGFAGRAAVRSLSAAGADRIPLSVVASLLAIGRRAQP